MTPVSELSIQTAVPLAPRSSLRVGGPARWLAVASSTDDVAGAHAWSQAHGVPMVVLGGGTNMVVADAGLDALVVAVQPRGLAIVEDGESLQVMAAAGEPWDAVVEASVARGGAGLECLSGIPGLTGGTPIQNVGAYGQDVSGAIEDVTAFDVVNGAMVTLPAADCRPRRPMRTWRRHWLVTASPSRRSRTCARWSLRSGGARQW